MFATPAQGVGLKDVLVGIPAYNAEKTISKCLGSVLAQGGQSARVAAVLVVASGCTDGTVEAVRRIQLRDGRIILFEEDVRRGKASALNAMFEFFRSHRFDYLIVTNSDAFLEPGAVDSLVGFAERTGVKLACGLPKPLLEYSMPPIRCVLGFMWDLHNAFLKHWATLDRPHCSDELMCFSRDFEWRIAEDTVNDGAYFSVLLGRHGLKCGFCAEAVVGVSLPHSLLGLLRQRSRIILGHVLLKKRVGETSETFERVALVKPSFAFRILVGVAWKWGLKCFIKAATIELVALLMAMAKYLFERKPWVWERIDDADTRG